MAIFAALTVSFTVFGIFVLCIWRLIRMIDTTRNIPGTTTHERVAYVRAQFDGLLAEDPTRINITALRELLALNSQLPHSAENEKLEDDMLEVFYSLLPRTAVK